MTRTAWILLALGCSGGTNPPADQVPTGDTSGPPAQPPTRYEAILALTGDIGAGGTLYLAECETCHELPSDPPGRYPPFAEVVPQRTDLQLITSTVDGVPSELGPMQPYGDDFTDQQIADLVDYMRSTFGG